MLFGGGQFDDVFGDIASFFADTFEGKMDAAETSSRLMRDTEIIEARLVKFLLIKLEPFVQGEREGKK